MTGRPDQARRLRIEIRGAVQGVGFRPFVYRLATELGVSGWVINDARGVFIEVEGPEATLSRFRQRLSADRPPRAIIHTLDASWHDPAGYAGFEIRHSDSQGEKSALVLPDVATCPDCLREVLEPGDRRHRYPFTNCTNCGPRFSIIQALPYDRPNTTMERFRMCPACQAEYDSPLDRRFHAQPNACPVCGPRLSLFGPAPESAHPVLIAEGDQALVKAAEAVSNGRIIALKGLGGFHLVVDARNEAAIKRLRDRKPRRDKPFAIMARDLEQARSLCEMPPAAEALMTSAEAPIVLLRRKPGTGIAGAVAPGNPYLGVMLPYTPLHHLLLRELGFPIVATSGNLTDEPICTDEAEALQRLGNLAELFLIHDRPIARHVDDSVAWVVRGQSRMLRRARGYAPLPVRLPGERSGGHRAPTILAVGAHLKNTVALSVGGQAFISQHIGDLETPEALAAFERVIADFVRMYEAQPIAVAHDLHPDYLSTRWALALRGGGTAELPGRSFGHANGQPPSLIAVQHHHAHMAACLAENGTEGPALGITWDGTGYGPDGTVWGGEFLLGSATGYRRVAHLRPFRLPGGDAAVHEPRRVALALLWEMYGDAVKELKELAPLRSLEPVQRRLLTQMLGQGINSPPTTSAGRLFDGIASLVGLRQVVTYEGQAAMELEFIADESEPGAYPLPLRPAGASGPPSDALSIDARRKGAPIWTLDWGPMIEAVLSDLQRGVAQGIMAARFHNALVEAIVAIAEAVGEAKVALTGGCFQNRRLTEQAARRLEEAGFEVLLHSQVPPNDGGISLGQVAVAAAALAA